LSDAVFSLPAPVRQFGPVADQLDGRVDYFEARSLGRFDGLPQKNGRRGAGVFGSVSTKELSDVAQVGRRTECVYQRVHYHIAIGMAFEGRFARPFEQRQTQVSFWLVPQSVAEVIDAGTGDENPGWWHGIGALRGAETMGVETLPNPIDHGPLLDPLVNPAKSPPYGRTFARRDPEI
jgi:hypothetical protein